MGGLVCTFLSAPIRGVKIRWPTGMVLEWRLSSTSLCVPSKTCTKISRPLFFFNGREIFVHTKGAFFSRPFFFIFHGNDGSGSSIFFFHFRDVRFTCMF